jgi:signal transduction histidine kinase
VDALQKRLDAVEMRSGTEARLLLEGTSNFPPGISDQLYRITQEALNNVLKHAQADHVTVYLRAEEGMIDLEVADDGCGFDLEQAGNGGMGLRTMQERAETINGRFTIHSQPGEGTSVKVEVGNHHE